MNMKRDKIKWVVPQYKGMQFNGYLISNTGILVSKARSYANNKSKPLFDNYREINPLKCKLGYYTFHPYDKEHGRKLIYAHRLVWESFVCPIGKGMVIDHINADKKDNRLSNLQMMTQSDNMKKYHTIDKLKKKTK